MKPKTMILMVVAVACGLGASFMTSRYLKAAKPEQQEAEPMKPVLVAKANVPAWTPIKEPEKYFEVKQYPESTAPRKALSDFGDVKNQRLRNVLTEGKPITQDDLITKEQETITEQLQPGQRAVAVKVTPESVVGGFVLPGSRVDIVCTTRGNDPQSKVVLQNMLVLAVDTQDTRNPETKTILGQNVTLAATPEEVARLTLAQAVGDLRLMLKSQSDTAQTGPVVVRLNDLDRPVTGGKVKEPEPKVDATPPATALPPVIDDPKTEQPKAKALKPHEMILIEGAKRTKHLFHPKVEEEEEDAQPESGKSDEKKPEEKKAEEKKSEDAKADPKKAPAKDSSAFGARSTRTGRVK